MVQFEICIDKEWLLGMKKNFTTNANSLSLAQIWLIVEFEQQGHQEHATRRWEQHWQMVVKTASIVGLHANTIGDGRRRKKCDPTMNLIDQPGPIQPTS